VKDCGGHTWINELKEAISEHERRVDIENSRDQSAGKDAETVEGKNRRAAERIKRAAERIKRDAERIKRDAERIKRAAERSERAAERAEERAAAERQPIEDKLAESDKEAQRNKSDTENREAHPEEAQRRGWRGRFARVVAATKKPAQFVYMWGDEKICEIATKKPVRVVVKFVYQVVTQVIISKVSNG